MSESKEGRATGGVDDTLPNPRHERFAQLIAQGRSRADAYREVYPRSRKWKESALHKRASALALTGEVSGRVEALKAAAADAAVMSAHDAQVRLSRLARDEALRPMETIASIKALADLCGYNAPTKTETTVAFAARFSDEELIAIATGRTEAAKR